MGGESEGDEHAEEDVGGSDEAPIPAGEAVKERFSPGKAAGAEKEAVDGQGAGGQDHLQDAEQDIAQAAEETEEEDDLGCEGHGESVEIATGDPGVGVDAPVAEKRPVAAGVFEEFGVDFGDEDLFLIVRGLGDDPAEGVGDK